MNADQIAYLARDIWNDLWFDDRFNPNDRSMFSMTIFGDELECRIRAAILKEEYK